MEVLEESLFFGVTITLVAYAIGVIIKKKLKVAIFNPLLISIMLIIVFLAFSGMSYQTYSEGADFISYRLTPATVCLAVPMYEQMESLKKNGLAILIGVLSGTVTSMLCVLVCSLLFKMNHETYVTLLPKSITTAIGIGVSEEMNGIITITIASIIITGIFGNIFHGRRHFLTSFLLPGNCHAFPSHPQTFIRSMTRALTAAIPAFP
jgi:putative effector of murein hydrolase